MLNQSYENVIFKILEILIIKLKLLTILLTKSIIF